MLLVRPSTFSDLAGIERLLDDTDARVLPLYRKSGISCQKKSANRTMVFAVIQMGKARLPFCLYCKIQTATNCMAPRV